MKAFTGSSSSEINKSREGIIESEEDTEGGDESESAESVVGDVVPDDGV